MIFYDIFLSVLTERMIFYDFDYDFKLPVSCGKCLEKKKKKNREKSGYRAFLLDIQGDADEEVRDAGQDAL